MLNAIILVFFESFDFRILEAILKFRTNVMKFMRNQKTHSSVHDREYGDILGTTRNYFEYLCGEAILHC